MSGMNVLKVGPDRIIGSRDMGVSEVAPGKRSCPGLLYHVRLIDLFCLESFLV